MDKSKKQSKCDIQKEYLKKIFRSMLETNKTIMQLQMTLTEKEEEKKGLKKFVKETEKAVEIINSICHYEILVSLYNSFINGKETYFVTLCKTINNKKTIVHWDRTEKGFKEFIKLEEEAKAKTKAEYEEKIKEREMIEKAKQEGKKIEMVYIDGKLKPQIVDAPLN